MSAETTIYKEIKVTNPLITNKQTEKKISRNAFGSDLVINMTCTNRYRALSYERMSQDINGTSLPTLRYSELNIPALIRPYPTQTIAYQAIQMIPTSSSRTVNSEQVTTKNHELKTQM